MRIEFSKLTYIQVGISNLEFQTLCCLLPTCFFYLFCEPIFTRDLEKLGTSVFIMNSHASWHMLLYFTFNKQAFMLQLSYKWKIFVYKF